MRTSAVLFVLLGAPAFADESPGILHSPQNELSTGKGRLVFRVLAPDRAGTIVVEWRPRGGGRGGRVVAARDVGGWIAELPEAAVQPPGFSYWAIERLDDGTERPIFASAADPHPVQVFDTTRDAGRRDELEGLRGRRSEMTARGEWVDFGQRRVPLYGSDVPDRYYRLEAGFSYAILSAVDRIDIAIGHLRGRAATLGVRDPDFRVGTDYGRAAITWLADPLVRIRTSILFGISQEGFEEGGGGDLILGQPWRTSFTVGVDGVTTLGWTGRVRLGWATVERVPMGASIAVTTFPAGEDAGVRLLYDVGIEIGDAWLVRAEGGYQGRTSVTGGPAAGLEVALRF